MSGLSLFFLAGALALAPLAVLRGRISLDRRWAASVFFSPALAVALLSFWVEIFPARPALRTLAAFFAVLLLYGIGPFESWMRREFLFRCKVWSFFRIALLSPLPWLLPAGRLFGGAGWSFVLALSAFHGVRFCLAALPDRSRNLWKVDLFLAAGALYPYALYLRSGVLFALAIVFQLLFLFSSHDRGSVCR
ncbi:MAG: hypothetical protein LBB14_00015 [Puniceicoccales bacterium]|jgi:hypothetical protein|nr:hypothetical protein [Puniceicoccales bacterium]